MAREWSQYQKDIFDEVANGNGNIVVIARAGSGKTSTIVEALNHIQPNKTALLCAFNKRIQEELQRRAPPGVEVKTLHSIGFQAVRGAWGNIKVDEKRTDDIIEQVLPESAFFETRVALKRLVGLAKNCWINEKESLIDLAYQFNIESGECSQEELADYTIFVLRECRKRDFRIDFDDMIWLPNELNFRLPQFDIVFVDETQDLNTCQLNLVKKACKEGGRIVAVGDDRQSVYKFRGADSDAIPRMIRELNAKTMPLSISYRCAKRIITEAQVVVKDIEAFEKNEEGEINQVSHEFMLKNAKVKDFILSRANAPLMPICLSLLRGGVPAVIQGRDIGKTLMALVKRSKKSNIPDLVEWLEKYRNRELEKLRRAKKDGSAVDAINDKVDTIIALTDGCNDIRELSDRMERLFVDNGHGDKVMLSSVHKAKGLESERVWMIMGTFRLGKNTEEDNIYYVAVTRAQKILNMVEGGPSSVVVIKEEVKLEEGLPLTSNEKRANEFMEQKLREWTPE